MRRLWRRWRCKCDCHGPGLAVPGLGWLIVTQHKAADLCCDRGAQANAEAPTHAKASQSTPEAGA